MSTGGADAGDEHWSDDGDLADEIELYGDLVVAASETDGALTQGEIDTALGIDDSPAALRVAPEAEDPAGAS